jgi:hypothetical protein
VLKKAGIVVATAAAGLLAVSPLAFASILDVSDIGVQVPVQACNNSVVEGVLGVLAKDQKNSDSHDGECKQKNSASDERSGDSNHDGWDHHGDDNGDD